MTIEQWELVTQLQDGPMTSRGLASRVQEAHAFTRRPAWDAVDIKLGKMRRAG